jgi:hypothetical protein
MSPKGNGFCTLEEHAGASPGGRQREPFEAPFLRQGKQSKEAPALHIRHVQTP